MLAVAKKKPARSRPKEKRLVARVSRTDKALIEKGAAIAGQSVASFVISHAKNAAEELVLESPVIRLNRAETKCVVNALLNPKPPSKAFLKSMKEYRASVISDVNPNSAALLAKRAAAGKNGGR